MKVMEKVFEKFDEFRKQEKDSNEFFKKIYVVKLAVNQKIEQAKETMIAKDYFIYKKEIEKKYKQFVLETERKNINLLYNENKEVDFLYSLRDSLVVNVKDFYTKVAEFLTLNTGKYFFAEAHEETKFYHHKHGYGDDIPGKVFKILHKNKEIFRSGHLTAETIDKKTSKIFSFPSNSFSDDKELVLIFPFKKAVNIFKVIYKTAGRGFGWDYKANLAYIKKLSNDRYSQVKEVAPNFNPDDLTNFIIEYINQNCKLDSLKLNTTKDKKEFELDSFIA